MNPFILGILLWSLQCEQCSSLHALPVEVANVVQGSEYVRIEEMLRSTFLRVRSCTRGVPYERVSRDLVAGGYSRFDDSNYLSKFSAPKGFPLPKQLHQQELVLSIFHDAQGNSTCIKVSLVCAPLRTREETIVAQFYPPDSIPDRILRLRHLKNRCGVLKYINRLEYSFRELAPQHSPERGFGYSVFVFLGAENQPFIFDGLLVYSALSGLDAVEDLRTGAFSSGKNSLLTKRTLSDMPTATNKGAVPGLWIDLDEVSRR